MAQPRLRADAARNRSLIIETARAVWAEDRDAPLQTVARQSGVGQGTLYRHFPNREALVLAVYAEDFDGLIDAASTLLVAHAPVPALRLWLDQLASFGRSKHALAGALDAVTGARVHDDQLTRITAAIDALLDAGEKSGELRADARADDLLHLASFLWHSDDAGGDRTAHLLDLVVKALRL